MHAVRRTLIAATTVAAALFGLMAPTASAGSAWSNCYEGDICVYNGLNGTGDMCSWDGNDRDWYTNEGSGSNQWVCSWAQPWDSRPHNVKSIWNRGTLQGGPASVKFYLTDGTYYACAHGPTADGKPGFQGNTGPDAGAHLRSHMWVSSC